MWVLIIIVKHVLTAAGPVHSSPIDTIHLLCYNLLSTVSTLVTTAVTKLGLTNLPPPPMTVFCQRTSGTYVIAMSKPSAPKSDRLGLANLDVIDTNYHPPPCCVPILSSLSLPSLFVFLFSLSFFLSNSSTCSNSRSSIRIGVTFKAVCWLQVNSFP